MEKLMVALAEKGIRLQGVSDKEIEKIAKGVGLDPVDFRERKVEVGPYTNKREETNTFIKTSSYIVGRKANGKAETVRGLYVRVETLDDMIADLQRAKAIVEVADEGLDCAGE